MVLNCKCPAVKDAASEMVCLSFISGEKKQMNATLFDSQSECPGCWTVPSACEHDASLA